MRKLPEKITVRGKASFPLLHAVINQKLNKWTFDIVSGELPHKEFTVSFGTPDDTRDNWSWSFFHIGGLMLDFAQFNITLPLSEIQRFEEEVLGSRGEKVFWFEITTVRSPKCSECLPYSITDFKWFAESLEQVPSNVVLQ